MFARMSSAVARTVLDPPAFRESANDSIRAVPSLDHGNVARVASILRLATGLIFFGHGALALTVNPGWLPFFAVVGLSAETGTALMPLIGVLDIALAVLVVVRPVPIALAWMITWALWTALLRPLSGQSILEFIERGGNWGAPLALLLLLGIPKTWAAWVRPFDSKSPRS